MEIKENYFEKLNNISVKEKTEKKRIINLLILGLGLGRS